MALRSQNWRIRVEQPLAGDGVGAKAHPYRPSDRDHVQQRNGRDEGANGSELSPSLPEKPSLRSEDDPRTLQAIAEGRRLTPQDARPIFDRWTRTDAADHWKGYADEDHRSRRVFVGRLPRMPDHHTVNEDVRHMFRDYNVEAVSKVIVPESPAFGDRRAYNHRYLFVDFSSADEAQHAVKEFNGRMAWGVKIRVQSSSSSSRKIHERDDYDDGNHDLPSAPSSLSYD
ncbi:MAG: hypothetical protein LQ352_000109 [Teloschistes flavicans]|nr:MAG: hypothetical protein LQ352_000109 [Teloschistes flavicans]